MPSEPSEPKQPATPTSPASPITPRQPADPAAPRESRAPNVAASPADAGTHGGVADEEDDPSQDKCADFGTDDNANDKNPARAYAFLGFDKEFVPTGGPSKATVEQGMRWIYLASNCRFAGAYLQGPVQTKPPVRVETDPTWVNKAGVVNDRGWMAAYATIEQEGWGYAPIYFGCCNKWPVSEPMSESLGRAHARHAKAMLAPLRDNLGLDLAGAVIYVDDEDVQGKQEYFSTCRRKQGELDPYVDYYRGFADELSLTPENGPAYRFGVYAHSATLRLIMTGVPETFGWQVLAPERSPPDWNALATEETSDPALWIAPTTGRSPRRLITDSAPNKAWPVLRQFRLDIAIDPAVSPPAPWSIDLDSSFVMDPSEPIATPRLAYVPGTTMLVRQRTFLARYSGKAADWKTATQTLVRRGSLGVLEGGMSVKNDAAFIDVPAATDAQSPHPDSPVATARDKQGRLFAAAVRRDRGLIVAEIVAGAHRTADTIPGPLVRRPLNLSLVGLDDQVLAVFATRAHEIRVAFKVWPTGTWMVTPTAPNTLHPLGGLAASGDPTGTKLFVAGIQRGGTLFAATGDFVSGGPPPQALTQVAFTGKPPTLCGTSAVAAVSPSPDDDLAFAIAADGTMVMFFSNRNTGRTGFEPSVKLVHLHSRLGAVVESRDRVHVAAIDLDGEVRRWPVRRSGTGWALENSVIDGKGTPGAPNPWTDIALASTGLDAGFTAVAGVDETDDDPESRTHAFRAPFGTQVWSQIANS